MRQTVFLFAVLLGALAMAAPAFANPSDESDSQFPLFLQGTAILLAAHFLLMWAGGGKRVMRELHMTFPWPAVLIPALPFLGLAYVMPGLAYVVMAILCFGDSIAMFAWAVCAMFYRKRPAHLESVHPVRMLLASVLLFVALPLSLIGTMIAFPSPVML